MIRNAIHSAGPAYAADNVRTLRRSPLAMPYDCVRHRSEPRSECPPNLVCGLNQDLAFPADDFVTA